jgi:hypothetical protein
MPGPQLASLSGKYTTTPPQDVGDRAEPDPPRKSFWKRRVLSRTALLGIADVVWEVVIEVDAVAEPVEDVVSDWDGDVDCEAVGVALVEGEHTVLRA